jgi:5-formyltetrahydrofolate cyclo-ligase
MDKSQLRETYRGIREGLSTETVAEASAALCRRLGAMAILQEAERILAYLAFRNEPDLGLLFDLLPSVQWVVPRVDGERLMLHPYDPGNLVRHAYGMREPLALAPVVDPADLDVVLVPGVAFDRQGGRLGFGGGFYDRLLVRTSAIRIGIAHDDCLADELPCAEHDQRMDWVVTPTQAIRCGPLWRTADAPLSRCP